MFVSVLFVICIGYISKKINIQQPLNILRWIIIIYAALGLVGLIISFIGYNSSLDRATGPYWWAYLLMIFCSTCLPLILLHKKLRNKKYLLLTISIVVNIGWLFERYVIILTSLQYTPPGYASSWVSLIPLDPIVFGIITGTLALLAGNFISRNNRALVLNKN